MNQSQETQQYAPPGQDTQLAAFTDPALVAAAETSKKRVEAQYQMALYRPRDIETCRQGILSHCKRPGFAEKAEYNKPIGNSGVTGPSIRFVETALREMKNIDIDQQITYEDAKLRRITVFITDLESNIAFKKSVTITKTVERKSKAGREVVGERKNTYGDTVYIVVATDDEIQNKENSAISKAIRTEGLRIIPSDITEEAMDLCRKTRDGEINNNIEEARRKMLDSFNGLGVKPKDIQEFLGHPLDQCIPAEINQLRQIYTTIKDGEAKWADYINEKAMKEAEKVPDPLKPGTKKAPAKKVPVKKAEKKSQPKPEKQEKPKEESETPEETPVETKSEAIKVDKVEQQKPSESSVGSNVEKLTQLIEEGGHDTDIVLMNAVMGDYIDECNHIEELSDIDAKKLVDNFDKLI